MRLATALAATVCVTLAGIVSAEGADRRGRRPRGKELKVGDMAPDFELVLLPGDVKEGDAEKKDASAAKTKPGAADAREKTPEKPAGPAKVRLSSFRGESPVVLILSSYT